MVTEGTATQRADIENPGIDVKAIKQDFTVTTKKPFKASSLADVPLVPGNEYNVTMVMGCYRDLNIDNVGKYLGINPNYFWNAAEKWGCKELRLRSNRIGINFKRAVKVGGVYVEKDCFASEGALVCAPDASVPSTAMTGDKLLSEKQYTLELF